VKFGVYIAYKKSSSKDEFHDGCLAERLAFLTGGDALLSIIFAFIGRFP
jgi:hypothetical protein